jgi:hypothetical protein
MPQVKAGVSCAKKISESTEEFTEIPSNKGVFAIIELLDAAYRRGRA